MTEVALVNVEKWIDSFEGREVVVVGRSESETQGALIVWHYSAPIGDEVIEDRFTRADAWDSRFTRPADGDVEWRVQPRPFHFGYEDDEHVGRAISEVRKELGFETTEALSVWTYAEGKRRYGKSENLDLPPVLLDAVEAEVVGGEPLAYVIDCMAKALGVSPGTLHDELLLRSSGYTVMGERRED